MKYLFWIDMEMSGLNPETDRILEVALVVTNLQMETLETYETAVFQDASVLAVMDEWNTTHHTASGLVEKVKVGKPEKIVEQELLAFFQKYAPQGKAVLAGNSIGQDRKFIDLWMPQLAQALHYRMLDVSSFKIVFESIYQKKFEKAKNHRAIDDILESIGELKYYQGFIKVTAS